MEGRRFVMVNLLEFGGVGDGKTLNTESFRLAVAQAARLHTAVQVPPGIYLTGTINLQAAASLYLEKGAVIKASSRMEDYPEQDYVHNEMGVLRALLVCLGGEDISVRGEGTIDLSGVDFFAGASPAVPPSQVPFTEEQIAECTYTFVERPSQSIFFSQVKGLILQGIRVLDSPCWALTFAGCEDVKVRDLTIQTSLNIPNDDGMHFCSCKRVTVSGCHIETGDDCIALTCITDWGSPCEDVIISDCLLKTRSKAIAVYQWGLLGRVFISQSRQSPDDAGGLKAGVAP